MSDVTLIRPPKAWLDAVLKILDRGDLGEIDWTLRADQDWGQFGMKHEAYVLLKGTLSSPTLFVEPIEMVGASETYAFLCPHPMAGPKPLYAKIGLLEGRLRICIFSMHVDLSGKLLQKIQKHRNSA